MNTLILGKGYIGNYLKTQLSVPTLSTIHISKKDLDYTNPYVLEKFIAKKEFKWIINCTGYTGVPNVDACEDNKEVCYYYNVTVPLYLTKVANKYNIPIIHIGSGCVYTGYDKAYTEFDKTNFGADTFESSFYSKTKDTFEKLSSDMKRYVFRIRIPFNDVVEPKNYLYKLYKYNNLISCKNSITDVSCLTKFVHDFITLKDNSKKEIYNYGNGIFNITNPGAVEAKSVTELMKQYGLVNPEWNFVSIEEANFRVARSNCILHSDVLQKFNMELPNIDIVLNKNIKAFANTMLTKVS